MTGFQRRSIGGVQPPPQLDLNTTLTGQIVSTDGATSVVQIVNGVINAVIAGSPGDLLTFTAQAIITSIVHPPPVLTIPTPPTLPVATPGDAAAAVTWAVPASNGGSPITGYFVSAVPAGGVAVQVNTVSPATFTTSFTGLTNGTAYTFQVVAVNAVGNSNAATAGPVTPAAVATVPAAATNVVAAAPTSAIVTVTWAAPLNNGGAALDNYRVKANAITKTIAAGTLTATFTAADGIINGVAYTPSVEAHNSVGYATAATGTAVTPTAPAAGVAAAVIGVFPNSTDATSGANMTSFENSNLNGKPVYAVRQHRGDVLGNESAPLSIPLRDSKQFIGARKRSKLVIGGFLTLRNSNEYPTPETPGGITRIGQLLADRIARPGTMSWEPGLVASYVNASGYAADVYIDLANEASATFTPNSPRGGNETAFREACRTWVDEYRVSELSITGANTAKFMIGCDYWWPGQGNGTNDQPGHEEEYYAAYIAPLLPTGVDSRGLPWYDGVDLHVYDKGPLGSRGAYGTSVVTNAIAWADGGVAEWAMQAAQISCVQAHCVTLGKILGCGEWGLSGTGGGANTYFLQHFYDLYNTFPATGPGSIAYLCYFNEFGSDGTGPFEMTGFPGAAQNLFRSLYGAP